VLEEVKEVGEVKEVREQLEVAVERSL